MQVLKGKACNCTHNFHQSSSIFSSQKSKNVQGKVCAESSRCMRRSFDQLPLLWPEAAGNRHSKHVEFCWMTDLPCSQTTVNCCVNIIMLFLVTSFRRLYNTHQHTPGAAPVSFYPLIAKWCKMPLNRFKGWPDGHSSRCSSHRFVNNFTGEWGMSRTNYTVPWQWANCWVAGCFKLTGGRIVPSYTFRRK